MGGCGRAIRGRSLPMVGGRLIVSLTRSRLAVALRGRGLARRGGGLPDLGLHSGGLEWGRRGGRLPLGRLLGTGLRRLCRLVWSLLSEVGLQVRARVLSRVGSAGLVAFRRRGGRGLIAGDRCLCAAGDDPGGVLVGGLVLLGLDGGIAVLWSGRDDPRLVVIGDDGDRMLHVRIGLSLGDLLRLRFRIGLSLSDGLRLDVRRSLHCRGGLRTGHCRGGLRTGLGRLRGGRLGGSVGVDPEVPALGGRAPGRIRLPPRGRRPGRVVDGPVRWRVEAIRHLVAPSEERSSGPGFPPRIPTSSRPVS